MFVAVTLPSRPESRFHGLIEGRMGRGISAKTIPQSMGQHETVTGHRILDMACRLTYRLLIYDLPGIMLYYLGRTIAFRRKWAI